MNIYQILESLQRVEESAMAEADALIQDIVNGRVDIYDVYAYPKDAIEKYVSGIIHKYYDEVVIDTGLHAKDDFEPIFDRVIDQLQHDYNVEFDESMPGIAEGTMKSSTKKSTGPKFTGYWKGKNKGTPGNKMVGCEESIEEGWKSAIAGAALAGATALGGGAAQARVMPGDNPDVNRLTGKPNVTQAVQGDQAKPSAPKGFSKEYLQSVVDGTHPRPMISKEKAQELLGQEAPVSNPKVNRYDDNDATLQVYKPNQYRESISEYWERFVNEYGAAGMSTGGTVSPGATGTPAPGQQPVNGQQPGQADPADAAKQTAVLQKNLQNLKTKVPGLNINKATQALTKADGGTELNNQDEKTMAAVAPQIADIVKNPNLAGQFKQLIDKSAQQEKQDQQKQQQQKPAGQQPAGQPPQGTV